MNCLRSKEVSRQHRSLGVAPISLRPGGNSTKLDTAIATWPGCANSVGETCVNLMHRAFFLDRGWCVDPVRDNFFRGRVSRYVVGHRRIL